MESGEESARGATGGGRLEERGDEGRGEDELGRGRRGGQGEGRVRWIGVDQSGLRWKRGTK